MEGTEGHAHSGELLEPIRTNGLAIASLVLGILWVAWIGSILAVVFGHLALGQIKRSNGAEQGQGLAIAGLVLGYIGISTLVLFMFLPFFLLPFFVGF